MESYDFFAVLLRSSCYLQNILFTFTKSKYAASCQVHF